MGNILLVSPPMPNTLKSTLTINSCSANYRPRSLSVLLLTSVTWIKFNFRLQMDIKLITLGAGETHNLQQQNKYPPLDCLGRGNMLTSFIFFLCNKPYIIHEAMCPF